MSLRKLWHNQWGSAALESVLLFPIITLMIVWIMMSGIYFYHNGSLLQTAMVTAERTSTIWNNSHREASNGYSSPQQVEPLYWKLQTGFSTVFRWATAAQPVKVYIPSDVAGLSESLTAIKLRKAVSRFPNDLYGAIQYNPAVLFSSIDIHLQKKSFMPETLHVITGKYSQVKANSYLSDPVELVRNVKLVMFYTEWIKGKLNRTDAIRMFREPTGSTQVQINNHAEAQRYLLSLVNGKAGSYQLNGGNIRKIDALTTNHIAHQAYYTFKAKQLLEDQMPKDIELLSKGKVSGVVWHFFGKQAPPDTLLKKLDYNGIAYVVHK